MNHGKESIESVRKSWLKCELNTAHTAYTRRMNRKELGTRPYAFMSGNLADKRKQKITKAVEIGKWIEHNQR